MSILTAVTLFWVLPALVTLLVCMTAFGTKNLYWQGKLCHGVVIDLVCYSVLYPITWLVISYYQFRGEHE